MLGKTISAAYDYLLDYTVETVLDRVYKNIRLQTLCADIDKALDNKDETEFMRLTSELKRLKESKDDE